MSYPAIRIALSPALVPRKRFRRAWLSRAAVEQTIEELFFEAPLLSVPEFEGLFRVDVRSHLFSRLLFEGTYEPLLAELSRRLIDPIRDVVDVGANIGFFSVLAARHTCGRVLAVEPADNALRLLKSNIGQNKLTERVSVFEGVITNVACDITLNFIRGKEEYSSIEAIRHPAVGTARKSTKSVPGKPLDKLIEESALDPGFVKIDVEGAEHKVYAGAKKVLLNYRPVLLSEFSPSLLKANGAEPDEIVRSLRNYGYRLIDPILPTGAVGRRGFGDLLGVPEEKYTDRQLSTLVAEARGVGQ